MGSNIRTTEDQTRPLVEVTDSTTQTLNLVDLSDPNHPKVVQRIQKPTQMEDARLQVEVGDTALFDSQKPAAQSDPRTITIVNFADPKDPKTVRRFADVTSVLADHERGLIYLANPEGLWVLQPHSTADGAAQEKQFEEVLKSAQSGG
jgi:hypothetical protein